MTAGIQAATGWWSSPPAYQASFLGGIDPERLVIALDPLPDGAPAVVRFRPTAEESFADQIDTLLAELDAAACRLFPRWLPGAERFDASVTLGIPAVRALAQRSASRSPHFGPFLADLAERSTRPRDMRHFPAEVRAAGLARVIADAYARDTAVVLIEIPEGLSPPGETALAGAAEWLAERGRFTVWLAGHAMTAVDRIRTVHIRLPDAVQRLVPAADQPSRPDTGLCHPVVTLPPLAGMPRADSAAEQALERALHPHPWARGREWNRTYRGGDLTRDYRLDLCWARERVVVEVDGPDHLRPLKWADDRDRDVHLQLAGYMVLRFPNDAVLTDVHLVVHKIHDALRLRAGARIPEMRNHAD